MIGYRFLAFILDYFISGIIIFPVSAFLWPYILVNYPNDFRLISLGYSFAFLFLYFFLFELIWKKTPGKAILKLKIKKNKDSNLTWFVRIFIRTLSRFIPLEPFSFLLFKNEYWLHDKLSKTIVVKN